MDVFDGMFTGLAIGIVLSLPAFFAELLHHREDLPIVVDVRSVWGREVPPTDVLAWSTALYLAMATIYGGLYPALVTVGVADSYGAVPLVAYTLVFYLAICLVAAPALGLGFFGRREGKTVWSELLISSSLFCLGYWYAANHLIIG